MEAAHAPLAETSIEAVVFDLGGVLIDWNPRYLYRQLFEGDEAGMEAFLATITTQEWNARQDGGRTWAEAVAELTARHPEQGELIAAYRERWEEMLGGPIGDTVEVLRELREARVPVYALTNWSAETFPIARDRFEFLGWFEGVVVSGEVRLAKPDPAIFHHLLERFGLVSQSTLFIDDHEPNIVAARALGIQAIRFQDATHLRQHLVSLGVLASD
jgi:2-haloacid dehalogenase